jgi:sugar lactone lactonase YvrE
VNGVNALGKGQVNFPQIPTAGEFPRALAVSPDGNTLLVAEFLAMTVRAIDVSYLNNA